MHHKIHLLSLILWSFSSLTPQTVNLEGRVLDAVTGAPVAEVSVVSGEVGTSTDQEGRFTLQVPEDQEITVSRIGYESVTLKPAPGPVTVLLTPRVLKGEEVVVRATRAVAGVTPVAFSNLTPEEIRTRYTVEDVPMILASEPGVYAYSESGNGTGYSYVTIRGFDQSRIAVMLDNVPLNDNESHQVYWVDHGDILADAAEVQIQRGIGNSLYGSSAFGGSINITTRIASQQREIAGQVGTGSFNTSKYQLRYNAGTTLGKNFSLATRLSQIESDGYREEHHSLQRGFFLGLEQRGASWSNQFRALIGYENSNLVWDGIHASEIENRKLRRVGYRAYTDDFLQQIYSLNTSYQLGHNRFFNNVTYLVLGRGYYEVKKTGRDFYSYNLDVNDDYSDEQELALTSDLLRRKWIVNRYYGIIPTLTLQGEGLRLDVGSELRFYSGDHFGEVSQFSDPSLVAHFGSDWYRYYNYEGRKSSLTGFVHLVASPLDRIRLIGDLQAQNHRWNLDQEQIGHAAGHQLAADWTFLNPRLGMVYLFDDQLTFFANYGQARKEPSDDQIIEADDVWSVPVMAAAEVIYDYELGLNFSSPKAEGSLNFYQINYLNEQLKNIDVEQEGEYDYYTSDSTQHQGVEYEFSYLLNPRLSLGLNGTLVLHTFTDQKSLPNVPASLFNLLVNYAPWEGANLFVNLRSIGEQYLDRANTRAGVIEPYSLVDVGIRYRWGSLELALKINNLFDKLYSTYGYGYEWDGFQAYYWPGATRNVFMTVSYSR